MCRQLQHPASWLRLWSSLSLLLLLLLLLLVALGWDELGQQAVDALANASQLAVLAALRRSRHGRGQCGKGGAAAGLALAETGGPHISRGLRHVLASWGDILRAHPGAGGRSLRPAGHYVWAGVQHAAGCGHRGTVHGCIVGPWALEGEQGGWLRGACKHCCISA